MNSKERREARYQRRKAKRVAKLAERNMQIGSVEDVFSFHDLYSKGKKCCNGVRWKTSTQNFEATLFSQTAKTRRNLIEGIWSPSKYVNFVISERGKTRTIDAPRIDDRQVQKVFTQNVLWPLYMPSMIYNNGASLPGKGMEFTRNLVKRDLRRHYRKYGLEGYVITMDFTQYFPSVSHGLLLQRHRDYIQNESLRSLADSVVHSSPGDVGLPLGVEPSQAEMIAFPSPLDNYIKCQLSIKGAGHYMDDYYILVPPGMDPREIAVKIMEKVTELRLFVKPQKLQILPFRKGFRFCKARYKLTKTGKVIMRCDPLTLRRDFRRLKKFKLNLDRKLMSYDDIWCSLNGMLAHLEKYDEGVALHKLKRYAEKLFGFSSYNGMKRIRDGIPNMADSITEDKRMVFEWPTNVFWIPNETASEASAPN